MQRYKPSFTEVNENDPSKLFVGKYITFINTGNRVVWVDGLALMPGDEWRENLEGEDELEHFFQIIFEETQYTPAPARAKNGKFLYVRTSSKKS